ncbi:MAG: sugar transferase [Alloprevotella sp.]
MKSHSENELYTDPMGLFPRFLTRSFDIIVSAFCILIFSPLYAYCYFLVRKEFGPHVIYKQERIGRGGKPFFIRKFRTMCMDAEKEGPQLCGNLDADDRLTPTGRFLRSHHLDELPQLWNVFVGDMAFVGPRPERAFYIEQIMQHNPRYTELYRVRPGVTSYATLYNGYTDSMEKMLRRLELDLYYLEHRSLGMNIKILWLTFYKIISGRKF